MCACSAVRKSSSRSGLHMLAIPARFRVKLADYAGSGLDRGHMAPAMNHKATQKGMDDTFYLTNISPQVLPDTNAVCGFCVHQSSLSGRASGFVRVRDPRALRRRRARTVPPHAPAALATLISCNLCALHRNGELTTDSALSVVAEKLLGAHL